MNITMRTFVQEKEDRIRRKEHSLGFSTNNPSINILCFFIFDNWSSLVLGQGHTFTATYTTLILVLYIQYCECRAFA